MADRDKELLREYYRKTAEQYDELHVSGDDAHFRALDHLERIGRRLECRQFLDLGSGTGRVLEFLLNAGFHAIGIEPHEDLRRAGIKRNPSLKDKLIPGDASTLPYADGAFDAVCLFGVMHHTREPVKIIQEAMRVTRKAVFISDSNRFAQGPKLLRYVKWAVWTLKLWPFFNYLKTKGKGYILTEGDGLSYSYSVYDNLGVLDQWADEIQMFPTHEDSKSDSVAPNQLLFTSPTIFLAALKH